MLSAKFHALHAPRLAHVILGELILHYEALVFQALPDRAEANLNPQSIWQIVVHITRVHSRPQRLSDLQERFHDDLVLGRAGFAPTCFATADAPA